MGCLCCPGLLAVNGNGARGRGGGYGGRVRRWWRAGGDAGRASLLHELLLLQCPCLRDGWVLWGCACQAALPALRPCR
eukprot:1161512-Pelagomonas_calceolata.AAC.7